MTFLVPSTGILVFLEPFLVDFDGTFTLKGFKRKTEALITASFQEFLDQCLVPQKK